MLSSRSHAPGRSPLPRPPLRLLLGLLAALWLIALVVASSSASAASSSKAQATVSDPPLIVVKGPNAAKWLALLRSSGAAARLGTFSEALGRRRLVLPAGTRLQAADLRRLRSVVAAGGRVVVADQAALKALGFSLRPRTEVDSVDMSGLSDLVTWPASYGVWPLAPTRALRSFTPLALNGKSTLLAQASLGRGRALAVDVDPFQYGLQGHEVFPLLGVDAVRALGADPGPTRDAAAVYFDPGSTPLTPEQVAARLSGFRTVYVAGWNYGYLSSSFDYPYQRLIDDLHAYGVRAYAWLEPPLVNLAMWTQHPECREKTQDGQDAFVDWRRLIALEDSSCFEQAWGIWSGLLSQFDWDGVNVAELYFENGSPSRFTPFHPSALSLFGGDPAKDPQGFLAWRTREVTALNQKLVSRIRALRPGLDVEMTVIDDELDPALGRSVGSSVEDLAAVARAQGATLQIEDPFTTWTQGPERYAKLSPKVTPLMPPRRAFFDINVVPRAYAHPTAQMTGVELSLSVMDAARASGKVALYSASTLTDLDLSLIPSALAGAAVTGDGFVSAPWTVEIRSPQAGYGRLLLDGKAWPAASGRAIIPAGRHRIAWARGDDGSPGLVRLAAELVSESASPAKLDVSYSANGTAWAVVSAAPKALTVDGSPTPLDARPDPQGGFAVRLPAGAHRVALFF